MASFSAELHVAGYVIPLLWCDYGVHQDTDMRGRVIGKARRGRVACRADVPHHQLLELWAFDKAKQLEATLLFKDAASGSVLESLFMPGAYCVRYEEFFQTGDTGLGAYTCTFELADPQGWSWQPGAPANPAAIQPAPGTHGTPPAVAAAQNASGPRKLVSPADVPPHLPAPQPNPSPDHQQVHLTQAEWQALIKNRWERNEASKRKKFTFLKEHHNTEFHVEGDPFTYRVDDKGKVAAVYDAQTQKSYNITGTRKGLKGIPLTLGGEPTYAGTEHMYPVTGTQKNVVQIKMAGNRNGDFKAANEAAGLADLVKSQGLPPDEAPVGYTWHHRDDFQPKNPPNPPYGTCTMELVEEGAHEKTFVHYGSCDQCNKHNKLKLYK